jgi:hypothetical protein
MVAPATCVQAALHPFYRDLPSLLRGLLLQAKEAKLGTDRFYVIKD